MGVGKQAKVLSDHQLKALLAWLKTHRHAERNRLIALLSFKAGLRAKEIAALRWSMVMEPSGAIGASLHLTNQASKGRSGRVIPLNAELRQALIAVSKQDGITTAHSGQSVIRTQRQAHTSAQAVVNAFGDWFDKLGFVGCSSHSGRRTFITAAARKVSLVGGSLRDVQALAGHASLVTTSRYIQINEDAQSKLVNLI